jgi:hypothetical protein
MESSSTSAGADHRAREAALSRLLQAYIFAGLFFMLVPGTLLGVWNLFQVSALQGVGMVSPAWLQAHGHAQIFGWVGSFILGIGFYSIPKLRAGSRPALGAAWTCWVLWTVGVAMRWTTNVYLWHWRVLLPVSGALELVAFLIFLRAVSQHRPPSTGPGGFEPWVRVVMAASVGFALTLVVNAGAAGYLAWQGESPALPHALDQRFLVLAAWGVLAPFIWGFSTRWLPVFLGLRPSHVRLLGAGVVANTLGVLLTLAGWGAPATPLFVVGAVLVVAELRLVERPAHAAKTRGVHASFPVFVRIAYAWLFVAAVLGVAAARWDVSGGVWGASRHAFTVGFVSVMIFSIGQRVLPAFAGARVLWSTRLMFAGLLFLTTGCLLRVPAEILAYQNYAAWAWSVLPASAVLELAGMTSFALNMMLTLLSEPETGTATA